jgi:hypothetical protein
LALETDVSYLLTGLLGGILGSLVTVLANWYVEEERARRERRITDYRASLDKLWRLLFYFGNMKSWGVFVGAPYAFATDTLGRYLDEMADMMKSEMFVGVKVRELWFAWQPYAVAAVEKRRGKVIYPQFNESEFISRSQQLHDALEAEYKKMLRRYTNETKTDS